MFRKFFIPALAVLCLSGLGMEAAAVSVDSDSVYCFRPTDFSREESLTGICITSVPDSRTGTVKRAVELEGEAGLRRIDRLDAGA